MPTDTSATTLQTLVRLSVEVTARSSRRDKIGLIADLLGRLDREETALAASYLAGEVPQGRVGVGPALVDALRGLAPVDRGRLTLGDLDRTFDALLVVKGTGAQAQRRELLRMLFEQATHEEQSFLARLMLGELRQGAVEGLVMEAVAQAAGLDPALVRRALMLSGDPARVTRTAFDTGSAGLRADALIPRLQPTGAADARAFLDRALAAGHEGIMAKDPSAPYAAGARGRQWLKIKPTQTLDLVVLAAEWGSGRRSRWLSNLHLGARDPAGGFVMLGKTFKGLTDAMLTWQSERLSALAVAQEGQVVYVRPELVVEIAFNELQESPQYPGGLALRFARVKRHRPDKTVDQADDIATVQALFRRQIAYSS
jgi:ATP-dependent DNA ligase